MHIETKNLPESIQSALRSVGYGRADILVRASESYTAAQASGNGSRAFVVAVEIATGRTESHMGSWGGANMFSPGNAVDLDTTARPLPPGFAVIEGHHGGGRPVYAELRLHPSNLAPLLPVRATLTERQAFLMYVFARYNSAGRRNEFERKGAPSAAELAELVALGYITQNRAGAVSVTTAGKNVAPGHI